MLTDSDLLEQFVATRSAEAFAEIVRRYTGLVYGVACRTTRDRIAAEDVAQDCFFQLTRKAGEVRGSLSGWLHRVALNRALEINRSEATRRRYERRMETPGNAATTDHHETTWADLAPKVDAALAALPDRLRTPMVGHFLCGQRQTEVAQRLGISQSAVSRRIDRGLERVRAHLRKEGVAVPGAGAFAALLTAHTAEAAPATLTAALTRLAAAGPATAAASTASTAVGAAATAAGLGLPMGKAALALVGAALGLALVSTAFFLGRPHRSPTMAPSPQMIQPVSFPAGQWWDDSFSQAVVAAAHARGVDADYTVVHRLSTNLFVPAVNERESCGAWWHWYGRDAAIDHVGAALGLRFEQLDLPEPPRWSQDLTPQQWEAACSGHRAQCAPIIRAALDAGQPVLTGDGWTSGDDGAFIPWCQWGVVRAVEDDSTIKGVTRDRDEAQLIFVGPCYAMTEAGSALTPRQAETRALRLAAQRIRAEGPFASEGDLHHGAAAMDRWIDRMATVPGFCADCQEREGRGWACANSSARRMIQASRQAADQLRAMASPDARQRLEAAAASYEHIADLLAPAVDDNAAGSYRQTVGDLTAQAAHADTLRQVKAELLNAADAMEQAATRPTVVRRFRAEDWADLRDIARDMHETGGTRYDHAWPTDERGARGMADYVAKEGDFWAVCLADSDRVVGLLSLGQPDPDGRVELGHMFHSRFRSGDVDTGAIRCILHRAFERPEVHAVFGLNAVDWAGQIDPLTELGFRETGRGPSPGFATDAQGEPIGFVGNTMELTRQAWIESGVIATGPDQTPRLVQRPAFRVLGVEDDRATLEANDPGFANIWSRRFMPHAEAAGRASPDGVHYNVFFPDPDAPADAPTGRMLVGMEVTGEPTVPDEEGWVIREVPATTYLVFGTTVRDVGDTWGQVVDHWLPETRWRVDRAAAGLDHHPPGTANVGSPMTIWLPVVLKEDQRLLIEGVPHETFGIHWDMLVRAAHTLLTFRGADLSLEQAMAYSGDAFNLCHASHWQNTAYLGAPHDPMHALADAVGFEYEVLSEGHRVPVIRRHTPEALEALTDKALAKIVAEIAAGRPVMVGGTEDHCGTWTLAVGYDPATKSFCHVGAGMGHAEETPYRWVKIRGVAPGSVDEAFGTMDGRVRGVFRDDALFGWHANPGYLFKQRQAEPPSAADRAIATLRLAVRLHRAEDRYRRNWGGVTYFFGEAAYEQWADALEQLDYPGDLDGPFETNGVEPAYDWYSMGNMDMQVDQIIVGRAAAAAFCDEAADVLPAAAEPLRRAAEQYRRQVAVAREAFAVFIPRFDGNDEARTAYFTDPDRRRQGAAAIRRMLEHERAAIAAIERALAILRSVIRRDGDRVWIDGVEVDTPLDIVRWDTMLHGLRTMLQHRGEDVTFEELAALSGEAFMLAHNRGWAGGDLHLSCPTDPLTNAARTLGYRSTFLTLGRPSALRKQPNDEVRGQTLAILERMWAELDAGRPVFAPGVKTECGRWGVITGYGRAALEMRYDDGHGPRWQHIPGISGPTVSGADGHWDSQVRGNAYQGHRFGRLGGWQGSAAFLLGEKGQAPSDRQRVVTTLRRAVELHHAPAGESHWPHEVVFGAEAYAAWAEDLALIDDAMVDRQKKAGAPSDRGELRNLELMVDQVVRGRTIAADYCDRAAELIPAASAPFHEAAARYREEAALAGQAFAPFATPTDELDDARLAWLRDPDKRAAGAQAVLRMSEHERAAIAAIQQALDQVQP